MKLIMESWNRFLTEEELKSQIIAYLDENNIILTEAELEEAMPRWMKKLGTGAALAATLAGAGMPAQAQAGPFQRGAEPTHQQAEEAAPETGKIVDNGDGTFSYTASVKDQGIRSLTKNGAGHLARVGLQKGGHSMEGTTLTNFQIIDGVGYATVTTALPGG